MKKVMFDWKWLATRLQHNHEKNAKEHQNGTQGKVAALSDPIQKEANATECKVHSRKPLIVSSAWFSFILMAALERVHKGVQDVPANWVEEDERIESKDRDWQDNQRAEHNYG
jgi:hypothetical protein